MARGKHVFVLGDPPIQFRRGDIIYIDRKRIDGGLFGRSVLARVTVPFDGVVLTVRPLHWYEAVAWWAWWPFRKLGALFRREEAAGTGKDGEE